MENIDQQKVDELRLLIEADLAIKAQTDSLWNYVSECEYTLIAFMADAGAWQGLVPLLPPNEGNGTIELGLFRWWIANPQYLDLSNFNWEEQAAIIALCILINDKLPASLMTAENAAFFTTNELIYLDGTTLGAAKYAAYDQGWFIAFLNLAESTIRSLWYNDGTFPTVTPPVLPLSGAASTEVNIALLGDWGTGDATSAAIMQQITNLKPDYIVHVGDVYYSGSPLAGDPNGSYYFAPGEETAHLFTAWPPGFAGKSFTLNSNHEMYSGANGYFYDGLLSQGSPFSAQGGSSCWALQYGGWTILGLDSAFMGTVIDAFMSGSIGGSGGTQGTWISGLGLDPQKVIVLTHHNGFAWDCSSGLNLWDEIKGALGGDPYAWYWGHVHYGIVYDQPITIPPAPGQNGFTTNTYARCLGHAALPYGLAQGLAGKPVVYSSNSPQPPPSKQLYNGFGWLTLTTDASGVLTSIVESYYDLSSAKAKYSKQIF